MPRGGADVRPGASTRLTDKKSGRRGVCPDGRWPRTTPTKQPLGEDSSMSAYILPPGSEPGKQRCAGPRLRGPDNTITLSELRAFGFCRKRIGRLCPTAPGYGTPGAIYYVLADLAALL